MPEQFRQETEHREHQTNKNSQPHPAGWKNGTCHQPDHQEIEILRETVTKQQQQMDQIMKRIEDLERQTQPNNLDPNKWPAIQPEYNN